MQLVSLAVAALGVVVGRGSELCLLGVADADSAGGSCEPSEVALAHAESAVATASTM